MKIEAGRKYLFRCGATATIYRVEWWDENGRYLKWAPKSKRDFDIIAECRDTPCLSTLRKSIGVRRWHTHRNLNQSLGDHIAGMHMIIETYHPSPSLDLLRAINLHDAHEVEFGDLPFAAKTEGIKDIERKAQKAFFAKVGVNYPSLSEEERLWLKFADQLDAGLFLASEGFNLTDEQEEITARCFEEAEKYAEKLKRFGHEIDIEAGLN